MVVADDDVPHSGRFADTDSTVLASYMSFETPKLLKLGPKFSETNDHQDYGEEKYSFPYTG